MHFIGLQRGDRFSGPCIETRAFVDTLMEDMGSSEMRGALVLQSEVFIIKEFLYYLGVYIAEGSLTFVHPLISRSVLLSPAQDVVAPYKPCKNPRCDGASPEALSPISPEPYKP